MICLTTFCLTLIDNFELVPVNTVEQENNTNKLNQVNNVNNNLVHVSQISQTTVIILVNCYKNVDVFFFDIV